MILGELGDVTRLSAARKAVRCAGLDIGVHRSDRRSRVGKLTRQGSPQLPWALFEAAQSACRGQSPDHADHLALKARGLSHVPASMESRGSLPGARSTPRASSARARSNPSADPPPPTASAKPTHQR